jgi:hypothetical protein
MPTHVRLADLHKHEDVACAPNIRQHLHFPHARRNAPSVTFLILTSPMLTFTCPTRMLTFPISVNTFPTPALIGPPEMSAVAPTLALTGGTDTGRPPPLPPPGAVVGVVLLRTIVVVPVDDVGVVVCAVFVVPGAAGPARRKSGVAAPAAPVCVVAPCVTDVAPETVDVGLAVLVAMLEPGVCARRSVVRERAWRAHVRRR